MTFQFSRSVLLFLILFGLTIWAGKIWSRFFQLKDSLVSQSEQEGSRAGSDFDRVRRFDSDVERGSQTALSKIEKKGRAGLREIPNRENLEDYLDQIFAPFVKNGEGAGESAADAEIERKEQVANALGRLETFARRIKSLSSDDLSVAFSVLAEKEIPSSSGMELQSLIFLRQLAVCPEDRAKNSILYGLDLWAVRSWLRQDFEKAEAWVESIKGTRKEAYRNGLVQIARVLSVSDFEKALRAAEAAREIDLDDLTSEEFQQGKWHTAGVPPDQRLDPILVLAGCQLSDDSRQRMIDYALKLPTKRRDDILNTLGMGILFREGFATASELFERQTSPEKANAFLLSIVCSSIETGSAAKASWLLRVSPRAFRTRNLRYLVHRWLEKDVLGVSTWLESLPPGKLRDEAVFVFATSVAEVNGEAALEWGKLIEDASLREQVKMALEPLIPREGGD
jgi:hypothetical protein